MSTITITADVDESLHAELEALASARGSSKAALLEEALRSYVASERDFLKAVEAGIADLEAGRLLDHPSVAAAVRKAIRAKP